ncbi:Uncharacterised protein [Mycobacterium tuberculosis]|nr:Uncharacterised protein [Mycobacterium tuberculosis]
MKLDRSAKPTPQTAAEDVSRSTPSKWVRALMMWWRCTVSISAESRGMNSAMVR